jgi:hypothetical protein
MPDQKSSPTGTPGATKETSADDAGQAALQAEFDKAQEQGYFGTKDPNRAPNEAYTVTGQASGEAARADHKLGAPLGLAKPDEDDEKK